MAGLAVSETVSWGVLYYAFGVLLQPVQADTGWSATAVSGALSGALLASALAAPVVGWVVDRHGARALMTAGSLLGALLFAAASGARSLGAFYAAWAGIGVAMAAVLYEPAFAVLSKALDGEARRRALTTVTLLAGLASTVFVPLATVLVGRHGWRTASALLALGLALVTVPLHAAVVPAGTGTPGGHGGGVGVRAALGRPVFWLLAASFVLGSLVSAGTTVHAVSCLRQRGLGEAEAAGAAGAIGAAQVAARLAYAPLARVLPSPALAGATFLLQAAGLGALAVGPGWPAVGVFVASFGAGNGLATLARATVVADAFGAVRYATIAGALAGPATVARALGPVAVAGAVEAAGGYGLVLGAMAALLLGAAALALAVPRLEALGPPGPAA